MDILIRFYNSVIMVGAVNKIGLIYENFGVFLRSIFIQVFYLTIWAPVQNYVFISSVAKAIKW